MTVLVIFFAIVFTIAGISKLVGIKLLSRQLTHWNLPLWFMRVLGAAEILIAGGLFCENGTIFISLSIGAFIMLGATASYWIAGENVRSIIPLVLWSLFAFLMWETSDGSTLAIGLILAMVCMFCVAAILWAYLATTPNKEGEIELFDGDVAVQHHFIEVLGVRYHYVEAGNPENAAIMLVHGAPESWYSFHKQIAALSRHFYVIAPDMKPYGQTANDLDGNHAFPHIARELEALIQILGIEKLHLAAHDRGVIAVDHLIARPDMEGRVLSYIRMQQSFNEPHGEPLPPHKQMASFIGTMAYRIRFGLQVLYKKSGYVKIPIDKEVVNRLSREFRFSGIPQAMPLSFKTTSFPKELGDREAFIFEKMTFPMLILQGKHDPGQHPEEYDQSHEVVPNCRVHFIDASHFFHLEAPEETSKVMLSFFQEYSEFSTTAQAPIS